MQQKKGGGRSCQGWKKVRKKKKDKEDENEKEEDEDDDEWVGSSTVFIFLAYKTFNPHTHPLKKEIEM